jgi:alkylation response protein AidB-like acyl-CoA dehydrogenase
MSASGMTQPDNFGFGEEAALLKNSARKFFQDHFPTDRLHALVASDPEPLREPAAPWDRALWQQLVDLGWTALAVPEAAGGVGMPLVAVAGLAEELGRAAFPCPLLPTLNASFVLAACGDAGRAALERLAGGATASLALCDRHGDSSGERTGVALVDGALHGTAWFVQEARKVDYFLVCARGDAGLGLFWVDAGAPGVGVHPDSIVDLTRDQAHVSFEGVAIDGVATDGVASGMVSGDAAAALGAALPAIWTIAAAEMAGAAEWQLQTTVDYANARQQFDRPLGFFQAVKHTLVNVMTDIDRSLSLVYNAACAFDTEPEHAARYAHMAKASASDAAAFASGRSVQCHGGIGFTWEAYLHLYFKRQTHSQRLWGDGAWHRARLADILMPAQPV